MMIHPPIKFRGSGQPLPRTVQAVPASSCGPLQGARCWRPRRQLPTQERPTPTPSARPPANAQGCVQTRIAASCRSRASLWSQRWLGRKTKRCSTAGRPRPPQPGRSALAWLRFHSRPTRHQRWRGKPGLPSQLGQPAWRPAQRTMKASAREKFPSTVTMDATFSG